MDDLNSYLQIVKITEVSVHIEVTWPSIELTTIVTLPGYDFMTDLGLIVISNFRLNLAILTLSAVLRQLFQQIVSYATV